MDGIGFPERTLRIRRATSRLCLRLGWAPLHEVRLANGRRADVLALQPGGGFVCVEVKSGLRDFLSDGKWTEYQPFCDQFFFAVDSDFPLDILPVETGLIVCADRDAEMLREPLCVRLPAASAEGVAGAVCVVGGGAVGGGGGPDGGGGTDYGAE